jgi:hypothetical protein
VLQVAGAAEAVKRAIREYGIAIRKSRSGFAAYRMR